MKQPLLSVCLITYNHAKYIEQAIEGVLMQKVNFSYELIIADDFSTDGTREILREYKRKYPEIIKLILQEENVGAYRNWKDLVTAPKTKYFAYFEGDDYWTDPLKLQKQVDFFENNPGYAICFHNAYVKDENSDELTLYNDYTTDKTFTTEDIIKNNFICSLSVMYLNSHIKIPDIFEKLPMGDKYFHVLNSKHGKIKYLNEVMGVYRKHSASSWSSQTKIQVRKKIITALKIFKEQPELKKYRSIINKEIAKKYRRLGDLSESKKDKAKFYFLSFVESGFNTFGLKTMLKNNLKLLIGK